MLNLGQILWQTDFILGVIFVLTNLCQDFKIRNKYLSLIFTIIMSPLHVLNTSEIMKWSISCKTASCFQRLVYIIDTINRILGGDRSDKRETFISALYALYDYMTMPVLYDLYAFYACIFIKFYFKAYWHWTCIQKKLPCKVSFILSYLFVRQMKKILKCFKIFTPNPHQGPSIDLLQSLQHLKMPTCIL